MTIPTGTTKEDIKARERIIAQFYQKWKTQNPSLRRYNLSLKDYVNIRNVSILETSEKEKVQYCITVINA